MVSGWYVWALVCGLWGGILGVGVGIWSPVWYVGWVLVCGLGVTCGRALVCGLRGGMWCGCWYAVSAWYVAWALICGLGVTCGMGVSMWSPGDMWCGR